MEILIIGAGPSGLALGACLARAGRNALILEQRDRVASSWHQHYDRLHLHTARAHSGLPHLAMPRDWPRYPSRLQVIDYLETYAAHFSLVPRFGEEARRIARRSGTWVVETDKETHRAERVVIATGYNRVAHVPEWPDRSSYGGRIIHSAEYRRGDELRGKRVLVVGLGNSGGEIAIDLVESGAAVSISIRGGVNVIPRDMLGRPVQETGILLDRLNLTLATRNAIARAVSRLAFGDLERFGLPPRREGVATQIESGRIPLIDVGTVDLIKRKVIALTPAIARFTKAGVVFTDGRDAVFDAIILATGYKTGLEALLEDRSILDGEGRPRAELGDEPQAGLHFLGFKNPPTGFLRGIAIDAQRLADRIAHS
jgi:indole-3-pyruvate monooxygenase